jgi:hypothetical protein
MRPRNRRYCSSVLDLDLHLQFFVIAIGDIEADAANELILIEWRQCGHGRLLLRHAGRKSSPIYVSIFGTRVQPRFAADPRPGHPKPLGGVRARAAAPPGSKEGTHG